MQVELRAELARRSEIIETLRTEFLAVAIDADPRELLPGTELQEHFGLESLDIIEFVSSVEFLYKVAVPDEDLPALTTLTKIADYLMARV